MSSFYTPETSLAFHAAVAVSQCLGVSAPTLAQAQARAAERIEAYGYAHDEAQALAYDGAALLGGRA